MIHSTKNIEEKSIPLSITQAALRIARQFADEQSTQEKKEQVYFSTLAVCVVNDYMEMMDIPTDLRASDSWNPAMRLYADVADLKLTGLGYLECRPVRSGPLCYIPPEVPDDRIGVVVVKIDAELQEATLLGFTKTVRTGELSISQLQTVDDLLEHLDRLERNQDEVSLSQWLQNIFEAGWQSVEEILAPKAPLLAFRYTSRVTRGKLIDLGIQLPDQSVALVVTLTPETEAQIHIKVQVYPTGEQAYLPPNLILKVLEGEGVAVMEARAGSANTHMTLEFSAQFGECFRVRVELGDISFTENFVV
jgi:hypothetical protein